MKLITGDTLENMHPIANISFPRDIFFTETDGRTVAENEVYDKAP